MRILYTFSFCFLLTGLFAQKLDHRLGYLIVQTKSKTELNQILSRQSTRVESPIHIDRQLSRQLGIYLITFDYDKVHQNRLLNNLRNERAIILAQYDHLTSPRAIPNDPQFMFQWQWVNSGQTGGTNDVDIDIEGAWDITTGGVTPLGDTIVVAIIDDGLDYLHQDITDNTWINHNEIPDNGVDDDDNGYEDDVYGWNTDNNNPFVLNDEHGLAVAGVVGAVGNNGIGITGINWNVKLMTIVGGPPESSVIAAYAYALEQRVAYEESNGERGAFVVATNSSFGTDFGQPADAPLWCSFYDSLGVHGILSAAATSNINYNIDEQGDLPTACPSEFLMSVTSISSSMQRSRGFGIINIDFAAPGEAVYTTNQQNGYKSLSGNSFASPIAAGLVALLYSAPCEGIAEIAHSNPAAAARYIRDIIFNGVEPDPVLMNETRFGGILNAANSMTLLMELCSDCPLPFNITSNVISDTDVLIDWVSIDSADAINARIRPLSGTEWDTLFDIEKPLLLDQLTGCTEYEIQLEAVCADTSTGFEDSHFFKTDGCCEIPAVIEVIPNANSFHAVWSNVLAAEYFLVQWRLEGEVEWMEEVTSLNEVTIENLEPCSFYEFRLQTNCDTSETGFSDIIRFRTRNCGNCIDLDYCTATSENASIEFIDSLILGLLVNHSGNNGGYAFFETDTVSYFAGQTYDVFLRPGFTNQTQFSEQFRIWIDANQDGVFDLDELLLDTVLSATDEFILDEITIPFNARAGNTRMRVSMAFTEDLISTDQEPCGSIKFGEIEDYCITIIRDNNSCPPVDTVFFDAINFTGAFMYWNQAEGAIAYTYRYRAENTMEYTELATVDTFAALSGLDKCTTYEVEIRTVCLEDTTSYGTIYLLETDCDVAVENVPDLLSHFEMFPNPANTFTDIRFTSTKQGEHSITIFNTYGVRLSSRKIYSNTGIQISTRLNEISLYPPGLYFIIIENKGVSETHRLVKI
ncbi:MAG: S8 family serine peptidase [Bacteroidota bacterium]|nr:S8 family serine peptidase [Bacteroidota bacterium]